MLQSQLSIDFQHIQFSSISQLLLANSLQRTGANLRLKGKRTLKAASSKTNLVGFFFFAFVLLFLHIPSFPASRGLSRRGKNERKERDLSLSFLSFLPCHERPLLAGKSQVNLLISFTGKKLHYPLLPMNFVLVKQEHTCNPSVPWKIEKKKFLNYSVNRSFIFYQYWSCIFK